MMVSGIPDHHARGSCSLRRCRRGLRGGTLNRKNPQDRLPDFQFLLKIKNPQGFCNLEDCTRFFILTNSPALEGTFGSGSHEVFWLPGYNLLSAPSHLLPQAGAANSEVNLFGFAFRLTTPRRRQWQCGVRPRLQRRDRAGLSPASLHVFRFFCA
mgnify:CR=1 FL=1